MFHPQVYFLCCFQEDNKTCKDFGNEKLRRYPVMFAQIFLVDSAFEIK